MVLSAVLGRVAEQPWHDRAHASEARGVLETVRIARVDAPRRRMRLVTDRGRDVALALPRDAVLEDGAVLHADERLMIVARIDGGPRLRLTPADAASGLQARLLLRQSALEGRLLRRRHRHPHGRAGGYLP